MSAPVITSLSSNSGTTAGGVAMMVFGSNLYGGTVTFGGVSASDLTYATDGSHISVEGGTPAGTAGTVAVIATVSGVASNDVLYTYITPPIVSSLSPTFGTTAGGTTVTITGSDFTGATSVTFGGINATSFSVTDANHIRCITPAGTAGTVAVIATVSGVASNNDVLYTYITHLIVIDSISPESGSIKGGTTIIITGTNLSAVTDVTIGGIAATDLNIVSSTRIICTTPAGDVGTDDVVAIAGNYGTTWTQTSAPTAVWLGVAMSSDGTIQTAVASGGGIYYSTDTGKNWTASTADPLNWRSVAMSSDGTIQTAVASGGGIYYSTDTGKNWTASTADPLGWSSVAISSDGTKQTAVVNVGGIYYSTDTGKNWTQTSAPTALWLGVAISSDGTYQTAVVNGGGIYYSIDTGKNWTASDAPLGVLGIWLTVAMSSDGLYQTACTNGLGIYYSTDTGKNWTKSDAPLGVLGNWHGVAMSSDGTYQTAVAYDGGIWTSVPSSSNSLDYTYEKIVISNICFPAGTPITTDQGNIPIDKINTDIHTIHNNPIVAITKTITQDTHLVCFEKHSLGLNKPNKKTVTSKHHKVYYNGKMTKAYHFLKQFKNVTEIEYNGEILYNVLMEKHDKLKVNNLTFETLDPKNIIAKLYTSNFDEEYKDNIIVMINHSIMQKDHRLYQNIINRVVNDKSLSTCFDEEPDYEDEEPEYEEPVNTTRIDTLRNSAEKTYHTQSINVKNKISLDNVTLHGKLTKYIKAQQSKDNQEAEVVQEEAINFKINMDNNVNLHSKLNKYTKMYQNKDNIDEIVKKKEFINNKKEEKEEKERQKRIETKNKMTQPVVEKAKTYKRVQIFKKNGTSKRLF